jgi:hypothetical protein
MAREAALAFFDKVRTDQTLRWRLKSFVERDVKSLLRFAAEVGYFFSLRDYRAALEIEGELTEEMRHDVAQGNYVIPGIIITNPEPEPVPEQPLQPMYVRR